jgi:hypothetical protein
MIENDVGAFDDEVCEESMLSCVEATARIVVAVVVVVVVAVAIADVAIDDVDVVRRDEATTVDASVDEAMRVDEATRDVVATAIVALVAARSVLNEVMSHAAMLATLAVVPIIIHIVFRNQQTTSNNSRRTRSLNYTR